VAKGFADGTNVVVAGGNCNVLPGVIGGLQQANGVTARIGLVWFDAHGDFNTPDTSYSGILAGMPLAVIAGLAGPRWREAAGLDEPIPVERMLLVGTRDLDKAEAELMRTHNLAQVSVADIRKGNGLDPALAALTATCELLYVNIDLDVLSPHLVPSVTTLSEGGFEIAELNEVLGQILGTGLVAAVCLTSLNPLGGGRGQTSTRSAWQVVQAILADWTRVPPLPLAFS